MGGGRPWLSGSSRARTWWEALKAVGGLQALEGRARWKVVEMVEGGLGSAKPYPDEDALRTMTRVIMTEMASALPLRRRASVRRRVLVRRLEAVRYTCSAVLPPPIRARRRR